MPADLARIERVVAQCGAGVESEKGSAETLPKPEGRKKTTLTGTDPYRDLGRVPCTSEVRTDSHGLAR